VTRAVLARLIRHPDLFDELVQRDGLDVLLGRAEAEAVGCLLAEARPDVAALAALRRRAILEEAVRHRELRRVFAAFEARGVRALVFKGAALAYTVYPAPWCRPRVDLDVLVGLEDRAAATDALAGLGYRRWSVRMLSDVLFRQDAFHCDAALGGEHVVDLHTQIANRVFFANRVTAARLFDHARPAPFAGTAAWQPSAADSLIIASVHRAAHHAGGVPLLWAYDVWLLARALQPGADVAGLVDRARAFEVSSLVARDLAEARDLFGDLDAVAALDAAGRRDPARPYLAMRRSPLGDLGLDLAALPRWRDRARFLRAHVLPPREFMFQQYSTRARWRLPWLYGRRAVAGAARWVGAWFERG